MNAVLSCIASGGELILSSRSVAVSSVSILVAFAIDGRLLMPPAAFVTLEITDIDDGAQMTSLRK